MDPSIRTGVLRVLRSNEPLDAQTRHAVLSLMPTFPHWPDHLHLQVRSADGMARYAAAGSLDRESLHLDQAADCRTPDDLIAQVLTALYQRDALDYGGYIAWAKVCYGNQGTDVQLLRHVLADQVERGAHWDPSSNDPAIACAATAADGTDWIGPAAARLLFLAMCDQAAALGPPLLTDAQWFAMTPHRRATPRRAIEGMLWVTYTRKRWQDVPKEFGSERQLESLYNRWERNGTWKRLAQALSPPGDRTALADHHAPGSLSPASRVLLAVQRGRTEMAYPLLGDEQWNQVAPLLECRFPGAARLTLEAGLRVKAKEGVWTALPKKPFGDAQGLRRRFREWEWNGTLALVAEALEAGELAKAPARALLPSNKDGEGISRFLVAVMDGRTAGQSLLTETRWNTIANELRRLFGEQPDDKNRHFIESVLCLARGRPLAASPEHAGDRESVREHYLRWEAAGVWKMLGSLLYRPFAPGSDAGPSRPPPVAPDPKSIRSTSP